VVFDGLFFLSTALAIFGVATAMPSTDRLAERKNRLLKISHLVTERSILPGRL
jgi:hypothetical protein